MKLFTCERRDVKYSEFNQKKIPAWLLFSIQRTVNIVSKAYSLKQKGGEGGLRVTISFQFKKNNRNHPTLS